MAWKILLLWIHATTVFVSYISCSKIQMIFFPYFFFLQAVLSPILHTIPSNTNHVFLHANLRMYCEMKRMITSWIKEWSWLFPFTLWRWIVHVLYAHEVIVTQILIQFLKLEEISGPTEIVYHWMSDYYLGHYEFDTLSVRRIIKMKI